MTKIPLAIVLLVALVGCGSSVEQPYIEQKVRVDSIFKDGCNYEVGTFIYDGDGGKMLYGIWKTGLSLEGVPKLKAAELKKAQAIIESGCLKILD